MKVEIPVPSVNDLVAAYNDLQGNSEVSILKLVSYVQMSRFDPRLFEILANYCARGYPKINPFELNERLQSVEWASAFGVVLNHSRLLLKEKDNFDHWLQISLNKISKAKGELFFLGLFDFNLKRIGKIIARPSRLFSQWGFFHDEIVLNKSNSLNRTAMAKSQRLKFLKKILRTKKIILVEDYRRSLNYQVSIRQAQRDLKSCRT